MRTREVEVVHWNPRKYKVPGLRLRVGPRKNNFGDLLGPMIVNKQLGHLLGDTEGRHHKKYLRRIRSASHHGDGRLVAVGSIMHFARDRDTIWGTGVNGKIPLLQHNFSRVDIRSVRGPLTANWLWENKGLESPEVFGDPGLLVGELFPALRNVTKTRKLTIIPNLNEANKFDRHPDFVSPTSPVHKVLNTIAESEVVVGSSLHAIVVADSLGIPSALIRSGAEPEFKYRDYFLGTGRNNYSTYPDLESALRAANSLARTQHYVPLANWDSGALLASFPSDMWDLSATV